MRSTKNRISLERQTQAYLRDLASLTAEIIRRMGASYGSPEDMRRDVTTAVKIMEAANRAALAVPTS